MLSTCFLVPVTTLVWLQGKNWVGVPLPSSVPRTGAACCSGAAGRLRASALSLAQEKSVADGLWSACSTHFTGVTGCLSPTEPLSRAAACSLHRGQDAEHCSPSGPWDSAPFAVLGLA